MNYTISLFHDYEPDGSQRPIWLAIDFLYGSIPWANEQVEINVTHYKYEDINDFSDDLIGCSVHLEELFSSYKGNSYLGVNLNSLKQRLVEMGIDPITIERLIIQVSDAAEILAMSAELNQ